MPRAVFHFRFQTPPRDPSNREHGSIPEMLIPDEEREELPDFTDEEVSPALSVRAKGAVSDEFKRSLLSDLTAEERAELAALTAG